MTSLVDSSIDAISEAEFQDLKVTCKTKEATVSLEAKSELINSILKEVDLFDPLELEGLDPKNSLGLYRPVSGNEKLTLRPLKSGDFHRGYVKLLSQLSLAGDIDEDKFLNAFSLMKRCPETYYVYVVESPADGGRVIATATVIMEQKFLRGCTKRGFLEDVVVCDSHRNRQLGKFMIAVGQELSKRKNAYKFTLNCRDDMVPFYAKLGFVSEPQNDNFMSMRFDTRPNPV
ncbi:unnamed protein product [Notodromas monacha]|uniref:Glucosamine 6-phosphate N-acetyltransferase n=1 Tax=Notodromas monacha TaxID=399045 RepID=A0A7R9BHC1_9CRUS|nr:unnamed protein product [Notodromas monacha]CAG0914088.1 unnamed protein product [Notodromas monacha]